VPVTSVPVTSAPVTPAPATGDTNGDMGNADTIDNATTVVTPTPPVNSASAPVHTAIPPVRPRNIPAETPAKPTQTAAAESVPVASPIPSAVGYVVQVSSQRTPADAQAAFQSLQRKYASVIGNMKPSIKKAELGDRGTYYRVRVGLWSSSTEASTFCAKLKAAGGDCVIARN
jgi:cell division protein FtsN